MISASCRGVGSQQGGLPAGPTSQAAAASSGTSRPQGAQSSLVPKPRGQEEAWTCLSYLRCWLLRFLK